MPLQCCPDLRSIPLTQIGSRQYHDVHTVQRCLMVAKRFPDKAFHPVTLAGQFDMFFGNGQTQSGMTNAARQRNYRQATTTEAFTLTKYPGKVARAVHSHGSAKLSQVMAPAKKRELS